MRFCYYFLLLLPASALAQPTTYYLKTYAWQLQLNRESQFRFWGMPKRELASLDSLPQTGENVERRGTLYLMQRDYETAVGLYEQSAKLDPKQHGRVGWQYLMAFHDYPRALQHYEAYDALTANFDDMEGSQPVSYLKGMAYRGMGNHAAAVEQFSVGIDQLEAKHGAEWVNYRQYVSRAMSLLALHQPDKALASLDKAGQNNKQSALVQYYRGQAFLQLNRFAEARDSYRDALFFFRQARAQGRGTTEDYMNPLTEEEIEKTLATVKP